MKNLVVLGCTGSIGSQTLDIIETFPDQFRLAGASARGSDGQKLLDIAHRFHPEFMVVTDPVAAGKLKETLSNADVTLLSSESEHCDLAAGKLCQTDMVVSALSGTAGLVPTLAAIEHGIDIALANKETLVTGGEFVTNLARTTGSHLYPVDSEHSAIYQSLKGTHREDLRRIILTCSGGPFSLRPEVDLNKMTPAEALAHPTWNMGRKISIDSATLMNKGLEIIEACWLFDVPQEKVDVVIHPQSIIHSMIETRDGSIMAQLSNPDMRHPILYALSGERHWECDLPRIDFARLSRLTFLAPDTQRFPCLNLAREALKCGGTMTAVLNTANELAVDGFCQGSIGFMDIPKVIQCSMDAHEPAFITSLDVIRETEKWTREHVKTKWKI